MNCSDMEPELQKKEIMLVCDTCGQIFKSKSRYTFHQKKHKRGLKRKVVYGTHALKKRKETIFFHIRSKS